MDQLRNLHLALQAHIARTGDYIRQEGARFTGESLHAKGRNDLVSHVDRTAEDMLTTACERLIPGSGFIREEGGELRPDAEWRWIIDPLDGTTNFVHDVPMYCISVALQYQGQTVLGCVYDVPRDEYFYAQQGRGAWMNGRQIRVRESALNASLLATGFPYTLFDRLNDYMAVLRLFMERGRGIRRCGSAALDLAWTACGRFGGFWEMGLNAWDVAAGALLVQEAGGLVTDFHGTDNFLFGREIAAANPLAHPDMLETLQEIFGKSR